MCRQLTSTDDLGVRNELASSVGLRPLWLLGYRFRRLSNRQSSQDQQYIVLLAPRAVEQDSTSYALSVDMDQSQLDYPASIWLASSTSSVLVHNPNTHGEHCCGSFLSIHDIPFCISLSSDIQQHLVRE